MLISSRPIVTTNNEGPILGTLIMGRFLDEEYVKTLVEQTHVNFYVWPVANRAALPEKEKDILKTITSNEPLLIRSDNNEYLNIYGMLPDVKGVPALLVRADIPKDISVRGYGALRFAMFSILAVGIVILAVLFVLLQKAVITPIDTLRSYAVAIRKTDNLTMRLSLQRRDEIGTLAREFDRMVEQLSEARKQLLEQSYHSGMSEMASGVLHNVRNNLSPMIVDIEVLQEELRDASLEKMQKALSEMVDESVSDARKKDLLKFMELATRKQTALVRKFEHKLDNVARLVSHMERILPDRDFRSFQGTPVEDVRLGELIRDALDLMSTDLRKIIRVDFHQSLREEGPVRVQRVSLRQVLANLLTNSAESIKKTG